MSSDKYYNPDKNLVYSGLSVCLPIKTGEDPNWSGIRIYNLLNSDIWESWYELNEELNNWSIDHGLILNPLVDQVYNKNSNNAQSGIAVAEAIHNRFSENVDLYSAVSLTEEDIELNDFGIYIYDETNNEIKSSHSNLTSYYPRLIPVKEKQIYRIITKKANESEITNYANAITYAIVKQNENNKLIVIEDKFNLIEEKIQINIIEIPQIDLNDTEKLYLCINSSWCENIQKQSSIKKVTKLELQSSSLTNKIIAYSNTKEHALDAAWNHYPEKIATQMHGGFIQMDEFNNKYIDNVDLICYNFFNNFNDDLSIGEVYEDYDITDMPDSYCKIIETFFQEALEKKGFLCCIIPNNMVFSLQLQMEKNQIETLVQQVKLICKKYAVPYYNDYETSGWSEKTDPDKAMPPPSMGKIKTFLNNLLV